MRFFGFFLALLLLANLASARPQSPLAHLPEPARTKIGGGLFVVFSPRASINGGTLPALSEAGVLVRFAKPPSADDIRLVETIGGHVQRERDGAPRTVGRYLLARLTPKHIMALVANPRIE